MAILIKDRKPLTIPLASGDVKGGITGERAGPSQRGWAMAELWPRVAAKRFRGTGSTFVRAVRDAGLQPGIAPDANEGLIEVGVPGIPRCGAHRHLQAVQHQPTKLENLIHRILDPARLNIEIKDRFGNPVIPREWFLVPLFIIDEAVDRIKDGTITNYRYDPKIASLVRAAG